MLCFDRLTSLKKLMLIKQMNQFKFQSDVCDKCHVFLMIFMNLSDIAYLNVKGAHTAALLAILAKVRP